MKPILFDSEGILPCVVIGAGVAGHAAAVWLDSFGVPFTWIYNEDAPGGMLHNVYNKLVNVPGHTFSHGPELCEAITAQIDDAKFASPTRRSVTRITQNPEHFTLEFEDGGRFEARVVILATGTRYKRLEIEGVTRSELVTHRDSAIISYSASRDGARLANREVAIIGGGDAAVENALILVKHGCKVHLLMRSVPAARRKFVARAIAHPDIQIHPIPTIVQRAEELDDTTLRLHLIRGEETTTLDVGGLVIRIGVEPRLPILEPSPARDAAGYLDVDGDQETSIPRLLAAGDVTSNPLRAIVAAAASGAQAARQAAIELGAFSFVDDEI